MRLTNQIFLIENFIFENVMRILLNLVSFILSFCFLFVNKNIIALLILKILLSILLVKEHLSIFPYFEYTALNDISLFYSLCCFTVCFSSYLPIIIWQILLNANNISYTKFLTKTQQLYYLIFYFFATILWYIGFIILYWIIVSSFQLIFTTQGSTNAFGLLIDYIPTLTHISNCYLIYTKTLVVSFITYYIIFFASDILTTKHCFSYNYEYVLQTESTLRFFFYIVSGFLIMVVIPPNVELHIKIIYTVFFALEIYMFLLKFPIFFKILEISKKY